MNQFNRSKFIKLTNVLKSAQSEIIRQDTKINDLSIETTAYRNIFNLIDKFSSKYSTCTNDDSIIQDIKYCIDQLEVDFNKENDNESKSKN